MSFLLNCPNCGMREVTEFRYAGQVLPDETVTVSNLPETLCERWYHRYGCRQWLLIDRNIQNNEVESISILRGGAV